MTTAAPTAEWVETPAPGIYPGMPFEQYNRINAVHYSTLKEFHRSAAHARQKMLHPPEPSEAFDIGHALHVAILEPERFEVEYIKAPQMARRSNADKAAWADFEAQHPGCTILKLDEYVDICRMRDSVWASQAAAELLKGEGLNEISVVWKDPETKLAAKARIDRLTCVHGWTFVIDVKSARDASAWAFAYDAAKYGYHEQGAFYLDGCRALDDRPRRFLHVVVEKEEPFAVAVHELDDASIDAGRRRYRKHLQAYAEAEASGVWPGYPDGIMPLSLPRWALKEGEEEI